MKRIKLELRTLVRIASVLTDPLVVSALATYAAYQLLQAMDFSILGVLCATVIMYGALLEMVYWVIRVKEFIAVPHDKLNEFYDY